MKRLGGALLALCLLALIGGYGCVGDESSAVVGGADAASPSGDAGGTADGAATITDAETEAGRPASSFCAEKLLVIGSGALFCADFDEPAAPFGGYVGGVFSATAYRKEQLLGGTATVQAGSLGAVSSGQRLVVEKPATVGDQETAARYVVNVPVPEPARGLRIAFDAVLVTRSSPVSPLVMLTLHRAATNQQFGYFEDNDGNPASVGVAGAILAPLYATVARGTLWHTEIVFDPNDGNTMYSFTSSLGGVPMKDGALNLKTIASALDAELILRMGATSSTNGDGAATVHYDNVLVQTLR